MTTRLRHGLPDTLREVRTRSLFVMRLDMRPFAADIVGIEDGRLAEHCDVLQDEATEVESKSGRPMFGDRFPG